MWAAELDLFDDVTAGVPYTSFPPIDLDAISVSSMEAWDAFTDDTDSADVQRLLDDDVPPLQDHETDPRAVVPLVPSTDTVSLSRLPAHRPAQLLPSTHQSADAPLYAMPSGTKSGMADAAPSSVVHGWASRRPSAAASAVKATTLGASKTQVPHRLSRKRPRPLSLRRIMIEEAAAAAAVAAAAPATSSSADEALAIPAPSLTPRSKRQRASQDTQPQGDLTAAEPLEFTAAPGDPDAVASLAMMLPSVEAQAVTHMTLPVDVDTSLLELDALPLLPFVAQHTTLATPSVSCPSYTLSSTSSSSSTTTFSLADESPPPATVVSVTSSPRVLPAASSAAPATATPSPQPDAPPPQRRQRRRTRRLRRQRSVTPRSSPSSARSTPASGPASRTTATAASPKRRSGRPLKKFDDETRAALIAEYARCPRPSTERLRELAARTGEDFVRIRAFSNNRRFVDGTARGTRRQMGPGAKHVLEDAFSANTHPSTAKMRSLAEHLDETFKRVRTWFGNRRTKARKLRAAAGGAAST